jgi:hypothetical protein
MANSIKCLLTATTAAPIFPRNNPPLATATSPELKRRASGCPSGTKPQGDPA